MYRSLLATALLVALLSGAWALPAPWLHQQHLAPTQDPEGRYAVELPVGNPSQQLTLRLDPRAGELILSHRVRMLSRTSTLDADGIHGSDLFYLGRYKLRLPVRWDDAAVATLRATTQRLQRPPDGVLGVGGASPLWRWWPEHSLAPGRWTLGGYDNSARRVASTQTPLLGVLAGSGLEDTLIQGDVGGVPRELALYSAAGPITVLPTSEWAAENFTLSLGGAAAPSCALASTLAVGEAPKWGACTLVHPGLWVERRDHVVADSLTTLTWSAVRRVAVGEPPDRVQLGSAYARGLWRWESWLHRRAALEPAYRGQGGANESRSRFTAVLGLMSVAVTIGWLATAHVRPKGGAARGDDRGALEGRRQLLMALMGYTVVLAGATVLGLLVGERLDRSLRFHYGVGGGLVWAVWAVVYLLAAAVAVPLQGWLRWPHGLVPHPHPLIRVGVEGMLFFCYWLALVGAVDTQWEFALALVGATVGAMVSTMLTLDTWASPHWSTGTAVSCTVSTLFYYSWLVVSNVPQTIGVFWGAHPVQWPLAVLYVVVVVMMPSFALFSGKQRQ